MKRRDRLLRRIQIPPLRLLGCLTVCQKANHNLGGKLDSIKKTLKAETEASCYGVAPSNKEAGVHAATSK